MQPMSCSTSAASRCCAGGNPVTAVTNANGNAIFTNLHFGNYVVRETAAPQGYELSDIARTAAVSASALNVPAAPYTVVNQRIRSVLPQSGSMWDATAANLLGIGLISVGVVIGAVKRWKRRRRSL